LTVGDLRHAGLRHTMSRDDRGATAIMTAFLVSLVLLFIAAFAIDLGMQRAARRDMQAVADIVALDMGRLIDGRTRAEIEAGTAGQPSAAEQLDWSVANNDDDTIGDGPTVTAYWVALDDNGNYSESGGIPIQVGAGDIPDGVVVRAGTDVGFAFGGITGVSSGDVERSAVAQSEQSGCFKVGTLVLSLATNRSALNGILGDALNTGVLSYDGILGANVNLLDIRTELGAGSPDSVALANVTMSEFVAAAITVLQNTPGTEVAEISALQAIQANANFAGITVGDVIDLGTDGGAALNADVNLFDMISGAAFIANGTNAISVPNLSLSVPGLSNISTSLTVIEKPRMACVPGPGEARTGQFDLTITASLDLNATVLDTGLRLTAPQISITVSLAEAIAKFRKLVCTDAEPSMMRLAVTQQDLARTVLDLGNLHLKTTVLGIPGLDVDLVKLDPISTSQPQAEGVYDLALPQYYAPTPYPTPQSPTSLPNVSVGSVSAAGLTTALATTVVDALLNPLVASINSMIVNQLAAQLGLRIAGVDLFAIEKPTCSEPKLVG
jgi:uncharacterized membrane protein